MDGHGTDSSNNSSTQESGKRDLTQTQHHNHVKKYPSYGIADTQPFVALHSVIGGGLLRSDSKSFNNTSQGVRRSLCRSSYGPGKSESIMSSPDIRRGSGVTVDSVGSRVNRIFSFSGNENGTGYNSGNASGKDFHDYNDAPSSTLKIPTTQTVTSNITLSSSKWTIIEQIFKNSCSVRMMTKLSRSMLWRMIIAVSSVYIIFGIHIESIFMIENCYSIFLTAFIVFLVDIIICSFVCPGYLFSRRKKRSNSSSYSINYSEHDHNIKRPIPDSSSNSNSNCMDNHGDLNKLEIFSPHCGTSLRLGSLMFWCDIVSTFSILYYIIRDNTYVTEYVSVVRDGAIIADYYHFINFSDVGFRMMISLMLTLRASRFLRRSVRFVYTSSHKRGKGTSYLGKMMIRRRRRDLRKSYWPDDNTSLHCRSRQLAALKIQRAWQNFFEGSTRLQEEQEEQEDVERGKSRVGVAIRVLTFQRIVVGMFLTFSLSILISSILHRCDTNRMTMAMIHGSAVSAAGTNLSNDTLNIVLNKTLHAASNSLTPNLYQFEFKKVGMTTPRYVNKDGIWSSSFVNIDKSRKKRIVVCTVSFNMTNDDAVREWKQRKIHIDEDDDLLGCNEEVSIGLFDTSEMVVDFGVIQLVFTCFVILVWFVAVMAFTDPVMTLFVVPIERMLRLLDMLMNDPLGYQKSSKYKDFVMEEDTLSKNTMWTKNVLSGMETSFLMSTIVRIGSLMSVGFGSAGAEIIRSHLNRGTDNIAFFRNLKGLSVSCIFMFCDIRQFTDATECLQEEVFVFTNKIAAVVHSICHSYGGLANKSVGDAFLLSWTLDEAMAHSRSSGDSFLNETSISRWGGVGGKQLFARNNQANKALLSVIKICFALQYDDYFLEGMSELAKIRLKEKFSKRKGSIVQMGFGLHAGKAVQGAIGSERKLDATYVSEAVDIAEYLESSTKKYRLKVLMSGQFHQLLDQSNQRRCRKIDQVIMNDMKDDDDNTADIKELEKDDIVDFYTFDMDFDGSLGKCAQCTKVVKDNTSIHHIPNDIDLKGNTNYMNNNLKIFEKPTRRYGIHENEIDTAIEKSKRKYFEQGNEKYAATERHSNSDLPNKAQISSESSPSQYQMNGINKMRGQGLDERTNCELSLPTGPAIYNPSFWRSNEIRKIRKRYTDGLFFQKFNSGLQAYFRRDWKSAQECFQVILERLDDGPSHHFLNIIIKNKGIAPRNFTGYSAP